MSSSRAASLKESYKKPGSKMIGAVSLRCPWHDSPLEHKRTRRDGTEFTVCKFYGNVCPFISWGNEKKAELWSDLLRQKLHEDVKQGPLHCYCKEKLRVNRVATEVSPNFQRFFVSCSRRKGEMQCNFFNWCDEPWDEKIQSFFDWLESEKQKKLEERDEGESQEQV